MFDIIPKIAIPPNIVWGIVVVFGVVITTTVKVLTFNKLNRKEAFGTFQTKSFCDERFKNIDDKIDNLKDHISERFDDLKCIIEKSGR